MGWYGTVRVCMVWYATGMVYSIVWYGMVTYSMNKYCIMFNRNTCIVARDNLHQHALTDWIMLDLGSILYAISKTVFVFALGSLKTKELSFWPMCHF